MMGYAVMKDQLEFDENGKIGVARQDDDFRNGQSRKADDGLFSGGIVEENGTLSEFKEFNHALITGNATVDFPAAASQLDEYIDSMVEMMVRRQSNQPFKKGSASVAWNPDFILYKCRQDMTSAEQVLFDIVSGVVSSNPTEKTYSVDVTSVQDYLPYKDESYAYKILYKASKSIQEKRLAFSVMYEGQELDFAYPYFDAIVYADTKKSRDHNAYISFVPSRILRMFLISATVSHGGIYQISGAAKIKGKNSKLLYYLLESKKDYCEYPGAAPGVFRISLDDFQRVIGYPESYRYADIRRNILEPTKEDVKKTKEIDFVFDYKVHKSRKDGKKLQVTDLDFIIAKKADLVEERLEKEQQTKDDELKLGVLKGFGYTQAQCSSLINACQEFGRDTAFLTKALVAVENGTNVRSKVSLLHYFLENGLEDGKDKEDAFDFESEKYNYEDLEKQLNLSMEEKKAGWGKA